MGIVRESLDFQRGMDPKKSMGLGIYEKIKEWMNEVGVGVKNFKVNNDFSIDTEMDIIAAGRKELFPDRVFPEYIRFNNSGSFDIDDCGLDSLIGCPKKVKGYFSCQMNGITTLEGFPEIVSNDVYCMGNEMDFTEEQIREICTSRSVEADDSE